VFLIGYAVVACAVTIGASTGRYIAVLRRRLAAATFDATHDPLTGLYNRRILHETISGHITDGREFAVAILDIDRFKDINDLYGHAAGDAVLVELARRLALAGQGITHLFRLGGDEFAFLVEGGDDHAVAVAKTVWRLIAGDTFPISAGRQIAVHISVGVAGHRIGTDSTTLLRQADTALSQAKPAGTVVRWHPGTPAPTITARPRHRQRDLHPDLDVAGGGVQDWPPTWRCWFDASHVIGLANHAVASRHHRRTDAEEDLLQDCPGGLEIVTDSGYVTVYSTGWPQPLRDPHNPDSVVHAAATRTDPLPAAAGPRLPHVAHLHLDAVDAIHVAANRNGLLEVTVIGETATFTLVRHATTGRD
jgi:diguanylate cyclase (GGDEF)-like protein